LKQGFDIAVQGFNTTAKQRLPKNCVLQQLWRACRAVRRLKPGTTELRSATLRMRLAGHCVLMDRVSSLQ